MYIIDQLMLFIVSFVVHVFSAFKGRSGLYSIFKFNLGLDNAHHYRDLSGLIRGGSILFLLGVLNGFLTSGTDLFVTLWLVRWVGLQINRCICFNARGPLMW